MNGALGLTGFRIPIRLPDRVAAGARGFAAVLMPATAAALLAICLDVASGHAETGLASTAVGNVQISLVIPARATVERAEPNATGVKEGAGRWRVEICSSAHDLEIQSPGGESVAWRARNGPCHLGTIELSDASLGDEPAANGIVTLYARPE